MTKLRLAVTGTSGQVARALAERASANDVEVQLIGRPALDLSDADSIARSLASIRADAIVNAAAYTAVDRAESEESLAMRVNGVGAGLVAAAAHRLGAPILQLSTDYVFDGTLDRPYRENDPPAPIGAYGRSKLAGEKAVAAANPEYVVLRTAWVYSAFGANFVKTMLRLGETRREVAVVADQRGAPTSALDIADAVVAVARKLTDATDREALAGVYHMTSAGEATWADFAEAIFAEAEKLGRPSVHVRRIATEDYPTAARRPANSRLNCERLAQTFGVAPPEWRASLKECVARILTTDN